MQSNQSPGVYIEEVAAGERPFAGAETAVAAFVGQARTGPFNTPTRVDTWTQFSAVFGGFPAAGALAQSVHGFFLNGGGLCHIVRIGHDDPDDDGVRPGGVRAEDYVGNVTEGTGIAGLEAIPAITMLCAPDLMGAYQRGALDLDSVHAVQTALISHCESMGGRMAILDAPPGLTAQRVRQWRLDEARHDSPNAALYRPWLETVDPATGSPTLVPPSGHIAGIWCRSDDTHGVQRAPANEEVRGATGLELDVTRTATDVVNPVGINVIRSFPGRGILVWGARTLSSQPQWRYLSVRRLVNHLEKSILKGTSWVAFEPSDEATWSRIRRGVNAFLDDQWRAGAILGATPREAFFVKCDSETNTAEDIATGHVVFIVGVAAARPAEFVIFRVTQSSGGR